MFSFWRHFHSTFHSICSTYIPISNMQVFQKDFFLNLKVNTKTAWNVEKERWATKSRMEESGFSLLIDWNKKTSQAAGLLVDDLSSRVWVWGIRRCPWTQIDSPICPSVLYKVIIFYVYEKGYETMIENYRDKIGIEVRRYKDIKYSFKKDCFFSFLFSLLFVCLL